VVKIPADPYINSVTSVDIAAIEARANAAVPGPWLVDRDVISSDVYRSGDGCAMIPDIGHAEALFIAHAREDVPAMLAMISNLNAQLNAARERDEAILQATTRAIGVDRSMKATDNTRALKEVNRLAGVAIGVLDAMREIIQLLRLDPDATHAEVVDAVRELIVEPW